MAQRKNAIALGSFDGLHQGHMAVMQAACEMQNLSPAALLFDKHPLLTLTGKAPAALITQKQRDSILKEKGVAILPISFSEIANQSPEEFFREVLLNRCSAGGICCGFNYRFGKAGAGDTAALQALCEKYGVQLTVCKEVDYAGEPVSSSRIRTAITQGEIQKANAMLGRPFSVQGEVIHGQARGHGLGFPTANVLLPENLTAPAGGVYASAVCVNDRYYRAMTNIGSCPSFAGTQYRSETFLFDFDMDIYGEEIEIFLLDFLRPEQKYDSAAALISQLNQDKVKAQTCPAFETYFAHKEAAHHG